MKLGFDMHQEQSQRMKMTPELAQAIGLLQLNTQELSTYIQEQLQSNTVLETIPNDELASSAGRSAEREDEYRDSFEGRNAVSEKWSDVHTDWSEQVERLIDSGKGDLGYRGYLSSGYSFEDNDYSIEKYATYTVTLREYMKSQLRNSGLAALDLEIAQYLIESLDDNGYLNADMKEVARAFRVTTDRTEEVLGILQGFEPAGIAARDLAECLRLQLSMSKVYDTIYETLITKHLSDIAENRLPQLAKALGISLFELKSRCDVIRSLEPKPGRQFASSDDTKYIQPDLNLEHVGEKYQAVLNENSMPHLRINSYYQSLLRSRQDDSQLIEYLKTRIDSAMWLLRSIEQRNTTILNVANAIIKHQSDFFDYGPEYLRPLTLHEIAEEVGVHESTVSRAVNGKYLQTAGGVYELKFFFKTGLSTSDGEAAVSTDYVKRRVREIISAEDSSSPLSDQSIADMLNGEGIDISRRTVAKYRDELHILSSTRRKRF